MKNKEQEVKEITCKSWNIENFSTLESNAEHYSKVFNVGGYAWKLLIKKGSKKCIDFLSIYLEIADTSNLPQGWSIDVHFNFTVVNQIDRSNSRTVGDTSAGSPTHISFKENSPCLGFFFMPLSDLSNGYILNDTAIIEVQIFSISLEQPKEIPTKSMKSAENIHSKKNGDLVEFKGLGQIEKTLVPLLEEVCSSHPSLMECKNKRSRKFTEWAFNSLGLVLQFLNNHKWKDMDEEAFDQLQILWEELEKSGLDLDWLQPQVKCAISMKGYVGKATKVNKLNQELVALEKEMKKIKENLANTEQTIEMKRKDLIRAKKGFQEKKCGFRC